MQLAASFHAMLSSSTARLICFLLLAGCFLSRCAREVIIDLPDEGQTKISLISHFTAGQPFRVKVSLSQPVYDGNPPQVPLAVDVSVAQRGTFIDKLFVQTSPNGEFFWQSRDTARVGEPYSITAKIAGLPVAQGNSFIPDHISIEPIQVSAQSLKIDQLSNGQKALRVPLVLRIEQPSSLKYFAFGLKHETEVFDTSYSPPILDFTLENSTFFLADGPTLALLYEIPEPVTLISQKYWDQGQRSLNLTAYIPFDAATERPRRIFVEWRTLTEEFYRYHLSIARQGNNNTPLADPDAVFNNINNGLGNVSGYSVRIDTIEIPF
jgi:hypothetical protein